MPIWGVCWALGAFGGVLSSHWGGAFIFKMPRWATAGIMSFGCGVLISAVAYDLLEDGFQEGGIWPIVAGAVAGSIAYAIADWGVSRNGGHHRKQSGPSQQQRASEGGGLALAIGSLLDGIPESIVLGLGLVTGSGVSVAMLAAIFLSNLPEGLSSALGMKAAGQTRAYIFGLWISIAILSAMASLTGAAVLGGASPQIIAGVNAVAAGALLTMVASPQIIAGVNAVAAGALLTMVVNTMIPEAVEGEQKLTGVLVLFGLLVAFSLSNVGAD